MSVLHSWKSPSKASILWIIDDERQSAPAAAATASIRDIPFGNPVYSVLSTIVRATRAQSVQLPATPGLINDRT